MRGSQVYGTVRCFVMWEDSTISTDASVSDNQEHTKNSEEKANNSTEETRASGLVFACVTVKGKSDDYMEKHIPQNTVHRSQSRGAS